MSTDTLELRMIESDLQERRSRRRFQMRLPIELQFDDSKTVAGLTRDVSATGVYFFITFDIGGRTTLEFILTFPPEITLSQSLRVRCTAKLVRVDHSDADGVGIAAQIHRYEFLSSTSDVGRASQLS